MMKRKKNKTEQFKKITKRKFGKGEEERVEEGGEEDMVNYHDFGFKCFL